MSGQSAKRYGLDVKGDLELESRLRRMELELGKLARGNEDATVLSRGKGAVPQVSGLRLGGTIPGGLTVLWNAVSISDLRRYDVQFATNLAFNEGLQTFTASTTTYPFTTATAGGATYYARVRAVNSNRRQGAWSTVLNTATGQAASTELADGAVDTDAIQDGAVTVEKNEPASAASLDPGDGQPGQALRVDSLQEAFEYVDFVTLSNIVAATNPGNDGEEKQGTIKFPGGLKIQFDTVSVGANNTTSFDLPEPYTEDHYTVITNFSSAVSVGGNEGTNSAWVPTTGKLSKVRIRNAVDGTEQIGYISIGKDTS